MNTRSPVVSQIITKNRTLQGIVPVYDMIKACTIAVIFLSLVSFSGCSNGREPEPSSEKMSSLPLKASPEKLQWFRDAKFGLFIHWGPYSHLAGEWNGKKVEVGNQAEWIMKDMEIPVDDYRRIASTFNPVHFDAREWVRIAQAAGMKYIVITAKHHDGFAMYHSKVTPYNIVDWTPFNRDPLKELSQACAEEGITFCFYYSHREDWDHPGAYGNGWDYENDWKESYFVPGIFENYLEEKAKPQLRELLSNYGPVGLVWFDRGIYTPQQGREFVRIVSELQPDCLVNSRVGNYHQESIGDYQSMNDNGMPIGGIEEYWETPQTLNETWGYSKFDTRWKSPETVIRRLIEIVSCGGNYLLNVGPTGEGEIPEASVNVLISAGQWVHRNAESIYGTSASPFPKLPFGYCTVKGKNIYLHIRDWPKDRMVSVPGLRSTVNSAYLLLDKKRKLPVNKSGNRTYITLPTEPLDHPITVLVLEIDGRLEVDPPIVQQDNDGTIELSYLTALTGGKTVKRFNVMARFHISKWTGPEDTVTWHFTVQKTGTFTVNVTYAANREWEGKNYIISVGTDSIETSVKSTGDWYEYQTFTAGTITIAKPGEYHLTIRPQESSEQYLMYLRSLTLKPGAGSENK